jgi:uncharacterized protein
MRTIQIKNDIFANKTIGYMKSTANFWGLLALGLCIIVGVNRFTNSHRIVSVKGLATREVLADHVIWPLAVQDVGNDLIELYSSIENKKIQIVKFLKDNGIKENEISMSAPEVFDRMANRYVEDKITTRYLIQSVITVSSENVELIKELVSKQGELVRQGIALNTDYDYKVTYDFKSLNDLKPEMVEEATRNAREVAGKFADDSGSKLGKIQNASQGQFTITDRDSNTPYIKNIRVVTSITYYLK